MRAVRSRLPLHSFAHLAASIACALAVAGAAHVSDASARGSDKETVVLSKLPPDGSAGYERLRRAAGKPAVEPLGMSLSQAWTIGRARRRALETEAAALGVVVQVVGDGTHGILASMARGAAMTAKQSDMKSLDMASKSSLGVAMVKPMNAAMTEYLLSHDIDEESGATPPVLRLPLGRSRSVNVKRTSVSRIANGYAWRGEIEGTGDPVTLLWWADGHVSGDIRYGDRIFTIKSMTGGMHAIVEKSAAMLPPDHAPANQDLLRKMRMQFDPLVTKGDALAMREAMTAGGANTDREPPPAHELDKLKDAPPRPARDERSRRTEWPRLDRRSRASGKPPRPEVVITLLVAYTPAVAKRYEDPARDLVSLAVEEANQSFRNSGLGFVRLELVHAYETNYVEAGSHFDHVWRFADKGDGYMDEVHGLRDRYKADVAVLIVHDPQGCGLATRVAADADEAFAVVHHECAASSYSLAHEIGHLIGARHDPTLDNSQSPFPFGHGYVHGQKWRTVMSYKDACNDCPRLPVWSNPNVSIAGTPAGTAQNDNAKVLEEQAARVAAFR